MRLELTQKFVLGQIAVVIVALTLPPVMRHLGVSAWGAVALVFGVSALMVWLFSRQISRRFRVLRACTDRIGRGDLSGGVELATPVLFPDETSDLAESLNSMLQNLRELVRHIQEVAGQVTESSRELSEGSQLVNEANLELGASMERVAERVLLKSERMRGTHRSHNNARDICQRDFEGSQLVSRGGTLYEANETDSFARGTLCFRFTPEGARFDKGMFAPR